MTIKLKDTFYHVIKYKKTCIGTILMFHQINEINYDRLWYNEHLKISSEKLSRFIRNAKDKGCSFVSLDELAYIIKHKKRAKKIITITLDDGYENNYLNGSPIFNSLHVPYTIYVCTQLVEKQLFLWWYALEDIILKNDKIELSDGRTFICQNKEEKEQAFLDIRAIILQLQQHDLRSQMNALFLQYDLNKEPQSNSLGLTWEELRLLSQDPLCTIGNHSHSHLAFRECGKDEIISDIQFAQNLMFQKVGIQMQHFAFPFGEQTAVSQEDIELVKQLGFITSATTHNDLVRYHTSLLELPRIFVTERNLSDVLNRIVYEC